jgi:hypothetical protein
MDTKADRQKGEQMKTKETAEMRFIAAVAEELAIM